MPDEQSLNEKLVDYFEINPYVCYSARLIAIRLEADQNEVEVELQALAQDNFIDSRDCGPNLTVYRYIPKS